MADIFSTTDARNLLQNKFVFMLGDSNMRATYKDLVQLLTKNSLISFGNLRKRGEAEFFGDKRIIHSGMIKGRAYVEGREYVLNNCHLEYFFITKCYTEDIERFLHRIKNKLMKTPDVFIMNSCLWDLTRWGPNGVDTYKENMRKLMALLKECLPEKTLFIWTLTLPVSSSVRGGLLIKQIDFLENLLRFEVMEANLFCRNLVVNNGYDVLDLHYHLRMQIHRRLKDGLHFAPIPVRFVTNLILTHIALSFGEVLPGKSDNAALKRIMTAVVQRNEKGDVELPKIPSCLNMNNNSKTSKIEAKNRKNRPYIQNNPPYKWVQPINSNAPQTCPWNSNASWRPSQHRNLRNQMPECLMQVPWKRVNPHFVQTDGNRGAGRFHRRMRPY